ncbi:DUF2335 domain-containing protein [Solilutibacter pythonis]|nr:DUF2335 domain-containing protein [Lysobacter pythonis]
MRKGIKPSGKPAKSNPAATAAQQAQSAQHQVAYQESSWAGPLPPPAVLAQFEQAVPGAAERILKMAEDEGEHARRIQASAYHGAARAQLLGQVFALMVALGGLASATVLALHDHDWVAGIVASTTVTTVVAAFLQARRAAKQKAAQ